MMSSTSTLRSGKAGSVASLESYCCSMYFSVGLRG